MKSPTEQPCEKVLHFDLVEKISEGGSGIVWKALDEKTMRPVALKFLKLHSVTGWFGSSQVEKRFAQEVELLARMDSPGIVRIYSTHLDESPPFFAMEWVDGGNLAGDLGAASLEKKLRAVLSAAEAIEDGHRKGVIHRDLKPANILVTKEGVIKVVDFGLGRALFEEGLHGSKMTIQQWTREGGAAGTVEYAPREQLLGKWQEVDVRSDVYSLGVVLFEQLTGRLPYGQDVENQGERIEEILSVKHAPNPRQWDGLISTDLGAVVQKAIQPERDDRYPSMESFARDLRNVLNKAPVEARATAERYYRARKHFSRNLARYVLAGASICILAGFVSHAFWQKTDAARQEQTLREEAEEARDHAELERNRAEEEAIKARQQALMARARNLLEADRLQEAWGLLSKAYESDFTPPWEIGYLLREIENRARTKATKFLTINHPVPVRMVRFLHHPDQIQFGVVDRDNHISIYQLDQLADRREARLLLQHRLPKGRWYWFGWSHQGFLFGKRVKSKSNESTELILFDAQLEERARFSVPGFVDGYKIDATSQRIGLLSDGQCFQLRRLDDGELVAHHDWPTKYTNFSNWHVDFQGDRVIVKGGTWQQPSRVFSVRDGSLLGEFSHAIQYHYAMSDGSHVGIWSKENGGGTADLYRLDDILTDSLENQIRLDQLRIGLGRLEFETQDTTQELHRFTLWQKDNINRVAVDWKSGQSHIETLLVDSFEPWETRGYRAYAFSEKDDLAILAPEENSSSLRLFDLPEIHPSPRMERDHQWSAATEQWSFCPWKDGVLTVHSGEPAFGSFPDLQEGERASYLTSRSAKGEVLSRWKLAWPEVIGKRSDRSAIAICELHALPDKGLLGVIFHEAPSTSVNNNKGDSHFALYQLPESFGSKPTLVEPSRSFQINRTPFRGHRWNEIALTPDGKYLLCDWSRGKLHRYEVETGQELKTLGKGKKFIASPSGRWWVGGDFRRVRAVQLIDAQTGEIRQLDKSIFDGATFTHDETQVMVGDRKEKISIFSVRNGEKLRTLQCSLLPLAMIPGTERLVAFKFDRRTLGSIVLADARNGELITTLDPSAHIAVRVSVIGDEQTVVASNSRRSLSAWQSYLQLPKFTESH